MKEMESYARLLFEPLCCNNMLKITQSITIYLFDVLLQTVAGVIDQDYRGNVGVVLFNFGKEDFKGMFYTVS